MAEVVVVVKRDAEKEEDCEREEEDVVSDCCVGCWLNEGIRGIGRGGGGASDRLSERRASATWRKER